ncbi:Brefeldin A-inhibited guanine nucleotide-exchange protein 1 [Sarcoptes scabiei]|uniref:Brefeldin A-inhibited guanine nucleotide-exchange protein 1 n=1 Tax=Sarcoptes scabiei TaxID=52283 RepID=A0A834R0Q9_SARSC|nr:Brefeldin A-inhibited guanine nucleotide-exchange protein 1 [Sarcoptes scabiei]
MLQSFKIEKIMFITRALEKILAERDIRKSSNSSLKKSCELVLGKIKNEIDTAKGDEDCHLSLNSSTLPQPKSQKNLFDEEFFFAPFELAYLSKSTPIVIIALDCLQKLIAYGHFTGNQIDSRSEEKKLLIDTMVNSICNCFVGPNTDDEVQLQIIKALLTIVTSQSCPVHEGSILLVIRTCYNIYLASKKLVNQKTAIAALTQMLSVVFSRMELISSPTVPANSTNFDENDNESNKSNLNCLNGNNDSEELQKIYHSLISKFNTEINHEDEFIEFLVKNMITSVCRNYEDYDAISIRSNQSIQHSSNTQSNQPSSIISSILMPMTPKTSPSYSSGVTFDSFESNDTIHLSFENIHQKDAYLIFRSLCKLSMKPLSENNIDMKSHELRSKILSLQLILQILQNSGPVFQNSDMFAVAIKQYLCVALSKNGVSNIPAIFRLSLAIFFELFQKFKTYLKMQIEVFFKEIILNILETITSSFDHKWMVIQALTRVCADAQSIVDIYVNYDCNLSSENILGRLVTDLSKIAQGGGQILDSNFINSSQERSMRLSGLECLVSILKCMVEWSNDLYTNPHQQNCLNEKSNPTIGNDLNETSSLHNLDDNPEKFEEAKNQKNIIDKGTDLFNVNPMKGIKLLQHHEIIDSTAKSIAQFFHSNDRLDKSQIGEYMGDFNTFNKEVMYAYVDQMDFSGKDIVSALRFFLDGFRLPGEAQKIDRFMEKFASRYFETNRNHCIFTSADTVYVLAYSIIMLTTDLHSPQVKRKMTKEDYIKLNRGINESKDLPEEYLSQIYNEIAENVTSEKARRLLYNMEMETMASTAKALMESVSHVESPFTSAKHLEHVRPMFRTTWTSFLAAFSVGLQDCDDQRIASQCLNGIRCAIRIACIFQMTLERDAFVQALSRFTLLNANCPITEIKTKNIDTIKTLISVANTDGNYLGKSWLDILRCISQLELAQLIGTGVKSQMLNNNNLQINPNGNGFSFQFKLESFVPLESLARNKDKESKISESMIEASSQSVVVAVDRIFTGSIHLDGNAIVDFVKALCQVSSEELSNPSNPRMFSLQKIVEISYYNMVRIRLQWSRIWEILGEHFNKVGCNPNEEIAFFAIDSLRQLSMKFIEKGELSNFRFQKDFLRPFEHIMKYNSSIAIRDMVVRCVAQMVNSQASNIKSGWKNIFSVFRIAALETDLYIFDLSFQTTCNIFNNIYENNFTSMIDSFQDAIKCLSEFGCNQQFPDTNMEAIRLIRACARYVAEQPKYFKEFNLDEKNSGYLASEDDRVWVRGWLPILFELSCIVNTCSLDVRTRALTVMFEMIKSHGSSFRENWWSDLFKIIFRIFDASKFPGSAVDRAEWMQTTCDHAIYSIVDVFIQFFDVIGSFLLKDVYSQLFWCVQQDNERLACSGVNCFENLVLSCGIKFNQVTWTMTIELIERIHEIAKPKQLFCNEQQKHSLNDDELKEVEIKFQVQLDLIQAIDNIVFNPSFSRNEDAALLQYLEREYKIIDDRCNQREEIIENGESSVAIELDHQNGIDIDRRSSRDSLFQSSFLKNNLDSYQNVENNSVSANTEIFFNHSPNGMFIRMNTDVLIRLAKFLIKVFNSSNRIYLEKTKSKLLADKLTLLSAQEIKSLLCSVRIMFYIYNDDQRQNYWNQIESDLISVSTKALSYYYRIENEYNRDNWTLILLLILHNVSRLSSEKFIKHIKHHYEPICNLLLLDLKPSMKVLIRRIFYRIQYECFVDKLSRPGDSKH